MVLDGLLYSPSHEWLKVEGKTAFVGISDHAQHALGSVVFIELPRVGVTIKKGDSFGAVESVKAASDMYLPVTGKILEVNSKLEVSPELLNDDPYGSWIVKIELLNDSELSSLLTSEQYKPLSEE
ncbi:MAG: glycine cleavage system protein H [Tenericutes bacterium HGW-Tenericutes-2]|jgi:glycine cleavage system H protein|nr:MAG: glycine cleavage system protein H [Tenericutes bacterium HGW-Tenericutes-2]